MTTGNTGALCQNYGHGIIRHSKKEYVREDCHTNGIESFWAIVKRSYKGTFHSWSIKHMQRYLNELAAYQNRKHLSTMSQLTETFQGMVGKRLMFRDLVG